MKLMMTDGKEMTMPANVESPTYIVTAASEKDMSSHKGGITKKHVLMVVSGVLVVALILVAILVGMYLFAESQKEIVKFSMKFKGSDDSDVNEDVESDPNDNVVMYHVTKPGQDAYVVNDFNKGMQIVKVAKDGAINCFVTALNKSNAQDASYITGPDSMSGKDGRREETFMISEDPVMDRSFLSKKAQDMCKGVAVYWLTRQCAQPLPANFTDGGDRTKRAIYQLPRLYGLYGLGGCCKRHYACELLMIENIQGTLHICQTYFRTGTCCVASALYPVPVPQPYCTTYYSGPWATPGLLC